METKQTNEVPTAQYASEPPTKREVFSRFTEAQIAYMMARTGADSAATAVASFCRLNMPMELR